MKIRFSSEDIVAIVSQLQHLIGMRVYQVYDCDTKTYLIKLNRYEEKVTLLLESGVRIHTTEFDWPKGISPSGFSMKLRKHIKNKRVEKISQLGVDRIIVLQFGTNDAAYHLILEMYDRGNIVFTDFEYTILNILRPRTDNSNDDVKFVVREKYPLELARQKDDDLQTKLYDVLSASANGDNLRKIFLNVTPYGPSLIDHIFHLHGLPKNASIGKGFDLATDFLKIVDGLKDAEKVIKNLSTGTLSGYIMQKEDKRTENKFVTNTDFHPYLYEHLSSSCYSTYPSFDKAVDDYFSKMEAQKIDSKTFQKEKEAMKKLENVKKDHEKRLNKLLHDQSDDTHKAELIEVNLELVENAITIVRSAVANQISWSDIWDLIQEAQDEDDPVAKSIKKLKLEINNFTLLLNNPFENECEVDKPVLVDIDLDLSAYGNARKYYDQKRHHAKKEQKTIEASEKAFKNAEKKTKQALKEVAIINTITKARKPMWFEKFIWFISSENYLVIAGRDIQQNEVIVKRYMKPGDVYVHADIHGASSVVIKNPGKGEISPKTLNEAGTLAVCYSAAWDAKILTSAWWVYHHQVSKTAPTGEYLTAGSFMIRGKKNYLLPSQLVLGFGFLFKLGEDSLERHEGERKDKQETPEVGSEVTESSEVEEEENISVGSQESEDDGEDDSNNDNCTDQTDVMNEETNEEENLTNTEVTFPDTQVAIPILERTSSVIETNDSDSKAANNTTIIIASQRKIKNKKTNPAKMSAPVEAPPPEEKEKSSKAKKVQRSKLKKIKEKYKDQDDEERELKMKILASAGEPKPDKKKKKKGNNVKNSSSFKPAQENTAKQQENTVSDKLKVEESVSVTETVIDEHEREDEEEEEEDDDITAVSEEMSLLLSLTGVPIVEDTLLFAVPVCAPYNSMQNYKYKVKLAPGTGRRGKASKVALNIFMHDKLAAQREKDCLRSVKDQDISRNFPGKVKLWHAHGKKK